MNFLNNVYLDNTVRNYLIVAGVILIVFILKRYLSKNVAFIFFTMARRVWKTLDKKSFIDLVVQPLEWFLLIAITVFSLDKLNFPNALEYKIYGHTTDDILSRTGTGIIIASFIWLLLRFIDFIAVILKEQADSTIDGRDNQLVIFFRDFLKVIIGIIGVLMIIKACFNQHIGNVVTGLSLVGAALALAAKESLENLIASFIIFFDKPFFTDDVVKVNGLTGKVERIGLRSTRIRTVDKTLVTVPNKQMVDSIVDNQSMRTQRRAEIKLDLSPRTPLTTVQSFIDLLKKLLEQHNQQVLSSTVYMKEISKNGITISIEYFTASFTQEEFDLLKQEMNFSIKKIMEEKEIELSGETNVVLSREA